MRIVSVNVGLPREVEWNGLTVQTGIFKKPVDGKVKVSGVNLSGDGQADLTVHGGPEKAVYAYPSEHYVFWRKEFPEMSLPWGTFGENLTTQGLAEDTVHIGDRLQAGSAILMVTQPRMPCYKLALRFNRDDIIKRFLRSRRSGFYFSIVQEGEVSAGSEITILSRDSHRVTVTDISQLYLSKAPQPEVLRRAIQVTALPQNWKDALRLRAEMRTA